jgi:drug/metabolite transporter (DMT)-like permease
MLSTTIVLSSLCSFLFGITYSLIVPVSQSSVPGPVISVIKGIALIIINMMIVIYTNNVHYFYTLKLSSMIFIIPYVLADFVYMVGMKYAKNNAGIFTVITNLFPLITILLNAYFHNFKINYYYYSIGSIFSLTGGAFMIMAKN